MSDGGRVSLATFVRRSSLASLAAMFAGLGTLQVIAMLGSGSTHVVVEKTPQLVESLQGSTLPVEQSGFTLTQFDTKRRAVASGLGVHSAEWLYLRPKAHAEVACDFPFVGWNELDQSYRAQGWDIIERRIIVLPADKDRRKCLSFRPNCVAWTACAAC